MRWDLEERTEDAIVSYLKTQVGSDMRVSAAWELNSPEYPAAIVHVGTTEPVSEPAEWHDARILTVSVAVITEAAPEMDTSNAVLRKARERNSLARSMVMDALFISGLNAALVLQGIPDIAFSMAQFSGTERTVEGHNLITTLTGEVIAEPVTGS